MKTYCAALLACVLAACGSPDAGAPSAARTIADIAVANAGFEAVGGVERVPGWVLSQHAGVAAYDMRLDPQAPFAGKASFRMQRLRPQVYGSITQKVAVAPVYAGKTLELSAMTRTSGVGPSGWQLVIDVPGTRGTVSVTGSSDWQRRAVRIVFPPGAAGVTIGAMLLDDGTAWLDDVRLRVIDAH